LGKHRFVIDEQVFDVQVHTDGGGHADVTVNGRSHRVQLPEATSARAPTGGTTQARPSARRPVSGPGELRAPMAGLVLQVPVVGQQVRVGDALVVLDAMKMENTLAAPTTGVVQEVAVLRGDTVVRGALLVRVG